MMTLDEQSMVTGQHRSFGNGWLFILHYLGDGAKRNTGQGINKRENFFRTFLKKIIMKTEGNDPTIGIDKFVDISTHRLRIILSDLPSEHTIVLEAGGGKDSDSYQTIQSKLTGLSGMRVMSYDRSGFGLSELGPAHFSAVDEVKALKRCLEIQGSGDNVMKKGLRILKSIYYT